GDRVGGDGPGGRPVAVGAGSPGRASVGAPLGRGRGVPSLLCGAQSSLSVHTGRGGDGPHNLTTICKNFGKPCSRAATAGIGWHMFGVGSAVAGPPGAGQHPSRKAQGLRVFPNSRYSQSATNRELIPARGRGLKHQVYGSPKEDSPMLRTFACAVVALLVLSVGLVMAADKEAKGTIKKVDADKNTITVTVDGKDTDFMIGADAKILDATGGDLKD